MNDFYEVFLAKGKVLKNLLNLQDKYARTITSKNARSNYTEEELYMVCAPGFEGTPLKEYKVKTIWLAMAVIEQVHMTTEFK